MRISRLFTAAAAAILAHIPAVPASAADQLPLDWTISPSGSAADKVQFQVTYEEGRNRSNFSNSFAIAELQGLSAAQLASVEGAPVRFRVAREAGTLDCQGVMRQRRGTGDCRFMGNAAFAEILARRGIGRPTVRQQFNLTMTNVGTPLLAELDRQGYRKPTLEQLVGLGIHGATADYLRGLDSAGYRLGDPGKLTAMRIHGVTPDYIRELIAISPSYRGISADDLVSMRIHGISPAKVRGLAQLGYPKLSHGQLMQMAIHGVTPDYVRGMQEAGYRRLSPDELVQMRIHGVTPKFVREMADAGYRNLSGQQLLQLRIHGVSADMARRANAAVRN
jgi:hypothetical protein